MWPVVSDVPPIDPNNPCANTTLNKIENIYCTHAVANAFVDGLSVSPVFDAIHGVYKIASISSTPATIGFELNANGSCPTLNAFCHTGVACYYAMFDASRKCCPWGSAP